MKNITTKTSPDEIVRMFRESKGEVNFETPWGWIYLAGGILSKLQYGDHFISMKGIWVKV